MRETLTSFVTSSEYSPLVDSPFTVRGTNVVLTYQVRILQRTPRFPLRGKMQCCCTNAGLFATELKKKNLYLSSKEWKILS